MQTSFYHLQASSLPFSSVEWPPRHRKTDIGFLCATTMQAVVSHPLPFQPEFLINVFIQYVLLVVPDTFKLGLLCYSEEKKNCAHMFSLHFLSLDCIMSYIHIYSNYGKLFTDFMKLIKVIYMWCANAIVSVASGEAYHHSVCLQI